MRRNRDPRQLALPSGQTFEQTFWPMQADAPLPNLAAFDRLASACTADQVRRLNEWIEPQATCDVILKHHGHAGLARVMKGIAQAASSMRVAMGLRVAAYAGAAGIPVV